jgi:hypothetical protein
LTHIGQYRPDRIELMIARKNQGRLDFSGFLIHLAFEVQVVLK